MPDNVARVDNAGLDNDCLESEFLTDCNADNEVNGNMTPYIHFLCVKGVFHCAENRD